MPKAFIMIDVAPGDDAQIEREVSGLKGVVMAHQVTGYHDLIAFVDAEPHETFTLILSTIRSLQGVRHTDSHLVLQDPV